MANELEAKEFALCPDCSCPVENHLVGIGCTTIVAYERDGERRIPEGMSHDLNEIEIFFLGLSMFRIDKPVESQSHPVICPCLSGCGSSKKEKRKR
jgi:hypothetical protein